MKAVILAGGRGGQAVIVDVNSAFQMLILQPSKPPAKAIARSALWNNIQIDIRLFLCDIDK